VQRHFIAKEMTANGVSSAEIAAVMRGDIMVSDTTAILPPTPTPVAEDKFGKYVKMKKLLPEGAGESYN
jgi:hypothetical protein